MNGESLDINFFIDKGYNGINFESLLVYINKNFGTIELNTFNISPKLVKFEKIYEDDTFGEIKFKINKKEQIKNIVNNKVIDDITFVDEYGVKIRIHLSFDEFNKDDLYIFVFPQSDKYKTITEFSQYNNKLLNMLFDFLKPVFVNGGIETCHSSVEDVCQNKFIEGDFTFIKKDIIKLNSLGDDTFIDDYYFFQINRNSKDIVELIKINKM